MAKYEDREPTKQTIELKVVDSVDEPVPELTQPTTDAALSDRALARLFARALGDRPDKHKVETPQEGDRHFDEQKVVELLKNPESQGFLSAIDEMSPDEIGRVLHTLNAEKANHFWPMVLTLGLAFSFFITLPAIIFMPLAPSVGTRPAWWWAMPGQNRRRAHRRLHPKPQVYHIIELNAKDFAAKLAELKKVVRPGDRIIGVLVPEEPDPGANRSVVAETARRR